MPAYLWVPGAAVRYFSLLVCLLALAAPAQAAEGIIEELRNSLFESANEALRSANDQQASLLAPTYYSEGAENYRRAEKKLNRGGNIDSIRRDLERATTSFVEASEHAALAATTFELTLRAREDAISAGAQKFAEKQWEDARAMFAEAALRLEKGRLERAREEGTEAELKFRDAELTAIKANLLTGTRRLLEQAEEVRADRHAPKSFSSAARLLDQAERALTENRYDTDRPRSLAQQANHDAHHAIYVAGLEEKIDDKELKLEDVLLQWEASLRTIADQLDLAVNFDQGETQAVTRIREQVAAGIADNKRLTATLADRQVQLDTLVQETASMERLSKLVARQERQKERLARVQSLFDESEAIVLRQDDGIILRMIGLNFASGSDELKPEHAPLLLSLQSAIAEFPEATMVIEGHTDAFGSDADNLSLSQRRADAVQQYLLENAALSPLSVTALGYGESHPVANNETEEGRRSNRRIDVVIYPRW
jgi:outer membrane protein OmpA-like peptidoglycan-associated protein